MILTVQHLRVAFHLGGGKRSVPVRDVSFDIPENGRVALVGESGCGKSLTALTLGGLVDRAEITGTITGAPRLAYIFQNPMQSLNPVMRVGRQIEEARPGAVRPSPLARASFRGKGAAPSDDGRTVFGLLEAVGLPADAARKYPCELSGGQQQRVMIAMALAAAPDLLIADEPTTALDVTIQAQVLRLMRELHRANSGVLLITHDLGVVSQMATKLAVMKDGRVVETSDDPVKFFTEPTHPYSKGLVREARKMELES